MKRYLRILIALLVVMSTTPVFAQRYLDQYHLSDTSLRSQALSCTEVLNYFTEDKPDSLFIELGKDSNIVSLDSLQKYSRLHQKEYNYGNDGRSSTKWMTSTTDCFLERTYVGAGESSIGETQPDLVLVMRVYMKFLNGKFTITKISFHEIPPGSDVKQYIINPREERAMNKLKDGIKEKGEQDQKKMEKLQQKQLEKMKPKQP